jgi:hypothetical protein
LPAFLGPPEDYEEFVSRPIAKNFFDENKKEHTVFEDFISKFLYYLSLDNTDATVKEPWYSAIKTVNYLIEVQSEGDIV